MIAGRYRLEKEIGRGGAGVVHLAHDELLDRRVAVKRIGLLPGTTDDDVLRAQREARLAAGISHSHVVSIFDLVKDEDCYWLVMEHVDGRTLAELVAAEGPLPAVARRRSSPRPPMRSSRPAPPASSTATSSPATSSSARTTARSSVTSASPGPPATPRSRRRA